jgi:competence protein ComEC
MLAGLSAVALLQLLPRLPGERAPLACVLAAGLLALLWRPRRRAAAVLLACLVCALLSFGWACWRAQQRLADALPPAWEGRELWLSGRIDALPQPLLGQGGMPGWRFAFAVEQVQDPQGTAAHPQVPARVLLSAYAQPGQVLPTWAPGERWRVLAKLRRPHGQVNPHAFDYELWLFEQELRATGQLRRWERLEAAGGPHGLIDRWRQQLRHSLYRHVEDAGSAGVLVALTLGDQAAITRADWSLFRDTGTSHLMAISGLHVTMFAWAAGLLAGRLWRLGGRSCLWLPAPLFARWAGVLAALLYALFAGFGVPAQRTCWMLLVLALLRQMQLRWPWPLMLLASAAVVVALDPWALCQAGFWLSFAAVALLMAGGDEGHGLLPRLAAALRNQWIATLGLAPLTLVFFQQLSLVGLAANVLAIPLVTLLITPLALAGALLPELWALAAWLLQVMMTCLRGLAALPGAVWSVAVAPLWAQAAGLAGAVLLVLPLPVRLRLAALPLLLPLLWPALPRPAPGQFELLATDVGQGTAVLLRTRHHALLYDAGPQYTPLADAGQRVLLPLLRALGQRELDLLLLSHRDQDHVGGAGSLLAGLPVRGLLSSLEPGHPLLATGLPARGCERGQRWVWDGVLFEILHPRAGAAEGSTPPKPNALSCVLRVRAVAGEGGSALLTGDIEAAQEQDLALVLAPPRVDLLMVPHHGSQTSSSPALLAAAAPRLAFVQAGYRNRFGHPAPAVLARYQAAGVPVLASPACGALHWRSDTREARCERERVRRYWRERPGLAGHEEEAGPPAPPDQGF